jgi:hypothetical protein
MIVKDELINSEINFSIPKRKNSYFKNDPNDFEKKLSREHHENEKARIENENLQADVALKNAELELKKEICRWVKSVVSIYLIFIGVILFLLVVEKGKLESSVIIVVLSTTTINILGLPYLIIKSLFPEKKAKEDKEYQKKF